MVLPETWPSLCSCVPTVALKLAHVCALKVSTQHRHTWSKSKTENVICMDHHSFIFHFIQVKARVSWRWLESRLVHGILDFRFFRLQWCPWSRAKPSVCRPIHSIWTCLWAVPQTSAFFTLACLTDKHSFLLASSGRLAANGGLAANNPSRRPHEAKSIECVILVAHQFSF